MKKLNNKYNMPFNRGKIWLNMILKWKNIINNRNKKITQITNPPKLNNPASTFTVVNDAQIYRDMYFIFVLDYINN